MKYLLICLFYVITKRRHNIQNRILLNNISVCEHTPWCLRGSQEINIHI